MSTDNFVVTCFAGYHRVDTGFRLRLLGLGKTKEVKPLNEEMAVDLGADMLGELFIFSVGAGLVAAEYWRQSRKEAHHESTQDVRLRDLEQRVLDQGILLEQQSAQLRELDRLTLALTADVPKTIKDSASGKVLKVQK